MSNPRAYSPKGASAAKLQGVFRLLRFITSLIIFSIVAWFCVSVPVGKHTIWGHAVRIWRSPEAQDLAEGVKEKTKETAVRVQKELVEPAKETAREPAPPMVKEGGRRK